MPLFFSPILGDYFFLFSFLFLFFFYYCFFYLFLISVFLYNLGIIVTEIVTNNSYYYFPI